MSDLLLLSSALGLTLLGSGHCFAMCGAIASIPGREGLVPYQLGRALGYVGLGLIFGAFGRGVFTLFETHPEIEIALIVLMALLIVSQLVAVFRGSADRTFLSRFYRGFYSQAFSFVAPGLREKAGAFGLGLSGALLPCGFFLYFGGIAAATGSPVRGALFFLVLWIGSLPALLAAGTCARLISPRLRPVFRKTFAVMLLVIALVTLSSRVERAHASLTAASSGVMDPLICGSNSENSARDNL